MLANDAAGLDAARRRQGPLPHGRDWHPATESFVTPLRPCRGRRFELINGVGQLFKIAFVLWMPLITRSIRILRIFTSNRGGGTRRVHLNYLQMETRRDQRCPLPDDDERDDGAPV